MAKTEKAPKPFKDAGALRQEIEAILHSNGFDGTKAAGEIVGVVEAYIGEEFPVDEKKTEE